MKAIQHLRQTLPDAVDVLGPEWKHTVRDGMTLETASAVPK